VRENELQKNKCNSKIIIKIIIIVTTKHRPTLQIYMMYTIYIYYRH